MKQIHFIRDICGKFIWCACSISGVGSFAQQCTDDPNKVTCKSCRRTRLFASVLAETKELEVKP